MRLPVRTRLFDRRYAALPDAGGPGPGLRGEAGASSSSWYDDLLGGGPDVNPELSGSRKFQVYDEMAMTDPTIKSLFAFYALPARSAVWTIEPRSADGRSEPDAEARAIADAAAWAFGIGNELGQMDLSWGASIGRTITTGLKHGAALEELVFDTDGRGWRDADGDEHLLWPVAALAPRPAGTIQRVKRRNGSIVEVEQHLPNTRPMPAEKLSIVVFDPDETGRWEGSSMIRPAWGPWRVKKALVIASGMGWDRFASGIPVVYHPDNPDAEERAKRIGRQIRQHERAHVHFPSQGLGVSGTGRPQSEWYLDLVNGAGTLADPVPLLRFFTEQETEAGLVHFSRLGATEQGSRAVAEVQIDPFFLAVQAVTHELARERERQVFRRFVEVNFGAEAAATRTPRLVVSKIQAHNLEVIARAISYLTPAGFALTAGDHNDLRELLGFARLEEAAEAAGVTPEALMAVLREQGLTPEAVAAIVNALPAGIGVARNRELPEGAGLTA